MRYFRYRNTDKNIQNAYKEQYKLLSEEEKTMFLKEKRMYETSMFAFLGILIACIVGGFFLIELIPTPDFWVWEALVLVGKCLAGFIVLIVSGAVAGLITEPLWKKAESYHSPSIKNEVCSKACEQLRRYYKVQETYVVTKCFEATDKKFQNHDVCIFVAGDELRITCDLIHGFLHGERDLGCYAFKEKEISLSKREKGNHLVVELRTDKLVFVLGYRAKGFIEKQFLQRS